MSNLSELSNLGLAAELSRWKSIHRSHLNWYEENKHDLTEFEASNHRDCVDTQTYEMAKLTHKLDELAAKTGICKNPNNTLSIPEFTGTADELTEFLALVNYAKGTLK